jgi:thioredoxin reductase (NADPH)
MAVQDLSAIAFPTLSEPQIGIPLADSPHWTLKRRPFLLETSRPGVFAAGDVRSGSVKRVASAVGEGSMSVQFVHEFLKAM